MLQPGQPVGERLVGLHQLRDLRGLAPHHDDQLVARHLLRLEHRKIEPHPDQSPVTDTPTSPTCHVTMLTHRSRAGLNVYDPAVAEPDRFRALRGAVVMPR